MFTVTGMIEGTERTVRWADGVFAGDEAVMGRLDLLTVEPPLEVKLTANGPRVEASADDPVAAYATARAVFAHVVGVSGDVPSFDPADELDAVGTIY